MFRFFRKKKDPLEVAVEAQHQELISYAYQWNLLPDREYNKIAASAQVGNGLYIVRDNYEDKGRFVEFYFRGTRLFRAYISMSRPHKFKNMVRSDVNLDHFNFSDYRPFLPQLEALKAEREEKALRKQMEQHSQYSLLKEEYQQLSQRHELPPPTA